MSKHRLAVLPFAAAAALAALGPPTRPPPRSKQRAEKKDAYAVTTREPGEPVLALVSLDDQRVTIYDADGPILRAPVSSGQTGLETPVGIYAVLQKEAEHYSNVYDDAAMPHMERITWSGVALHGGALPGYPASHGCVRMPYKFAERLFGLTHVGMRVIVARNDVTPVSISHPLLFKRTPYRAGSGLVTKAAALVRHRTVQGRRGAGRRRRAHELRCRRSRRPRRRKPRPSPRRRSRRGPSAKKLEPDMKQRGEGAARRREGAKARRRPRRRRG